MLQMQAWRPTVTHAALGTINHRVPDPFERLFLQEYPKVVAIAYRVLADRTAAEDVAQEVFLKFHRSHSPDSERASGWLHAAAALGIKVGNVGTLLRRAEEAMRKEVHRATPE